ncbi:conserved hypothetical protein [Ricinus communis]|uniref:Uncharacterized protein n=1 Tax=Ricinus communis TaxID=3988 RepID=B9SM99_RICCO|nr:conserved hypothetical protein [Ricinus communis]
MDKKEDKNRKNLEDPKPEPFTANQNLSQDVGTLQRQEVLFLNARMEALMTKNHEKSEDMKKEHREIFEDFYEKRERVKGDKRYDAWIVIGSGSEGEEEEEEEENFDKLKALLNATVNSNIKQLYDKISRFKSAESKEIHGLEHKIHALLNDGDQDYTDFKNADQGESNKISFLDCLKKFDESDAAVDYETLKSLKTRAINHGKHLSHLVIILMFLKLNTEGVRAKLQVLGDSLKWVSQDENSVVINRFLDLLHTADTIMSHMKENESLERKAMLMLEEEEAAGFEGNINQELQEDGTDRPILGLLKEICRLELFWMHRGLPDSIKTSVMDDTFPMLVSDMEKCEDALKWLELDVRYPRAFIFREDHQTGMESDDYKAMESKINELWNGIQESEKEKEQKLD